jgi:hypothetical protein
MNIANTLVPRGPIRYSREAIAAACQYRVSARSIVSLFLQLYTTSKVFLFTTTTDLLQWILTSYASLANR